MNPTQAPIQMTRAQYQAKYGTPVPATPTQQSAPVQMTRAEYQSKYGVAPGTYQTSQPATSTTKNDLLDNPVTRGIQSIFPGKQVGQAIGTLGGLALEKIKGVFGGKDNSKNYDTSAPSPLQVAGDIAQGALTVAAPNIGNGATALGRIGANAALGAGLGATQGIAEGKGVGDIAKNAAVGGIVGGGTTAAGEGIGKLVDSLPSWLGQEALPKLKEGNLDYALKNTKLGTVDSMLQNSKQAVQSHEAQIQSILNHPQYATETGTLNVVKDVTDKLPNAELNQNKIISVLKQVAPQNKTLVDKVVNGEANLAEQNILRKELDQATKKAYTDKPTLTFAKGIGKTVADILRGNVQTTAKETVPIFSDYSKEINLSQALTAAQKKLDSRSAVGLYDILSAIGGGAAGGPVGAAAMVAGEKALRSPAMDLAAAKGVTNLAKTAPFISPVLKGLKAPALNAVSSIKK